MLVADAGPGALMIPILGGIGVAGGFWAIHGSAAPRARRFFLITSTVLCLGTSAILILLAQTQPAVFAIPSILLAIAGVGLLLVLRSTSPPPASDDEPAA
jgi:hypothetical protein